MDWNPSFELLTLWEAPSVLRFVCLFIVVLPLFIVYFCYVSLFNVLYSVLLGVVKELLKSCYRVVLVHMFQLT